MTDKKKKRAKQLAEKTGMSHQAAVNVLTQRGKQAHNAEVVPDDVWMPKAFPPGDVRGERAPASIAGPYESEARLGDLGPSQLKRLKREHPDIWKRLRGIPADAEVPSTKRAPKALSSSAEAVAVGARAALRRASVGRRDSEKWISTVLHDEDLHVLFHHEFACRTARRVVAYEKLKDTASQKTATHAKLLAAIEIKRRWMRGAATADDLFEAVSSAIDVLDSALKGKKPEHSSVLATLGTWAAISPHAQQASIIACWAAAWHWAITGGRYAPAVNVDFDYHVGKLKKLLALPAMLERAAKSTLTNKDNRLSDLDRFHAIVRDAMTEIRRQSNEHERKLMDEARAMIEDERD